MDDNLVVEQKVLDEAFLKMMEKEKMAPVDIDKLDKDTVELSHCSLWHSEHIGRITSSTMHQVKDAVEAVRQTSWWHPCWALEVQGRQK